MILLYVYTCWKRELMWFLYTWRTGTPLGDFRVPHGCKKKSGFYPESYAPPSSAYLPLGDNATSAFVVLVVLGVIWVL